MPGIINQGTSGELFHYKSFNGGSDWNKKDVLIITQTIPPCGQCVLVKESLVRQGKQGFEFEIEQDGALDELKEMAKEYGFLDQLSHASFPIVLYFDTEYLGVTFGLKGVSPFVITQI